jgi:membrane fusion protein (multidrug efflux system)
MAPAGDDENPDTAPAPSPTTTPARRSPSSRRRRRLILLVGLVLLLAAIAAGIYYYLRSRAYVSTDDAYIEGHPITVSARVAGNIVGVYVADNQHVPAGELLVRVDPRDYEIALERAQASLTAAQANEQKTVADVEAARAMWTQQQQDLQRNEALYQQGAVTIQTLQHSRAAERTARANLNAAEKNLVAVRAQTVVTQVAVEAARLQLSYTEIHAAEAGYVTQKAVEVGSYVAVGQPVLVLATDRMFVTANFKETQLTHMRPGQPATIRVDTYPRVTFRGHVDSIQAGTGAVFSLFPPENATGNFVKVVQRVPVKIVFDEPPDPNHRLLLGLSVRPRVKISDR